jgi:hypothetical protein
VNNVERLGEGRRATALRGGSSIVAPFRGGRRSHSR